MRVCTPAARIGGRTLASTASSGSDLRRLATSRCASQFRKDFEAEVLWTLSRIHQSLSFGFYHMRLLYGELSHISADFLNDRGDFRRYMSVAFKNEFDFWAEQHCTRQGDEEEKSPSHSLQSEQQTLRSTISPEAFHFISGPIDNSSIATLRV